MKIARPPLVAMVPQRHPSDCGAAALSMCLGISYEHALLAIGPEAPRVLRSGVWCTQLIRAAASLGVTLRKKTTWDVDADDGIAQIRFRKGPHHVLLLRSGLFFDTDFTVWDPEDFLKAKRGRPGFLLTRSDGDGQ